MPALFLLLLLLPSLTTSSPLLSQRAGGPTMTPIPPSCIQSHPVPPNTTRLEPCHTLTSTHQIYASYFQTPQYTQSQKAQNCLEQCHGFSGCKAAVMADDVPTPNGWYGTDGGSLETGCLFFNQSLSEADFVEAEEGTWSGMWVTNLQCPE